MASTLEDVVKEGIEERLLRNINKIYSGPDGHKLNPLQMYFKGTEVDLTNPFFKATYDGSTNWPSQMKAAWLEETYGREAGELILAVQSNLDEVVRGIDKPEGLYGLILDSKPYDGTLKARHEAAQEALKLNELLKDPKLSQETIRKYIPKILEDLSGKGTKNAISAVEFALSLDTKIVTNYLIDTIHQSLGELENAIKEDLSGAQEYLRGIYSGVEDDKVKKGLALRLGQTLTDIKAPLEEPKKAK